MGDPLRWPTPSRSFKSDLLLVFRPLSNVLFPDANSGHHQLTHDEPGAQPVCNDIVKYIMTGLGAFVQKLDSIEEGDGTLLDNMVLMATSDVSDGRTHRIDGFL